MTETEVDEVVLLVHGTFAAPEEGKVKWWEIGSESWQEIKKRLPTLTRLAETEEIFQWTGENQERDRYQAAAQLLDRLLELEQQGRPYHLVGHSHGGSVIWLALQQAVRRRLGKRSPLFQLQNLRSWTTVGTPFLLYRESAMGRWLGAILGSVFTVVSLVLTGFLIYLLSGAAGELTGKLTEVLQYFGVPSDNTGAALIIGSVVLVLLLLGAGIPGLALHMWFSAIRREALTVRQSARVSNQALLEFGDRWLGIWSREDEAINGLKSSVKLDVQLLAPLEFKPTRVFQYDRRIATYRFLLRWFLAPVLNRFVPVGNNMILSSLSKSAQGDDRPGCNISAVCEGPITLGDEQHYPTLPEDVDDRLIKNANDRLVQKAPDFVPKVRTLLADFSSGVALLGGGVKAAGFEVEGGELVHTSYFDDPSVLDLVAHHIREHRREKPDAGGLEESLDLWYRSVRDNVRNIMQSTAVRDRSLPRLGKGNGPAVGSLLLAVVAPVLLGFAWYEFLPRILMPAASFAALAAVILGRMGRGRSRAGARWGGMASRGFALGLLFLLISLVRCS